MNTAPLPLTATLERRVRFDELDPMGIMWHGNYASWFEDGREAIGQRCGTTYMDFYRNGVLTPIKTYTVDYRQPLRYGTLYTIRTDLMWTEAAKILYSYTILTPENAVATTASTTQLFTDTDGRLLLDPPAFYKEFLARWKRGEFR